MQDALYGRSGDTLNILCEDETAEEIIWGVLDLLGPRHGLKWDWIRVGRDTGAEEFPTHAAAFGKFGQLDNFVFVLDGDKRQSDVERRIRDRASGALPVLFLPGGDAPEIWVWNRLREVPADAPGELSILPDDLRAQMNELDSIYDSASDTPARITKTKLYVLGERLRRSAPQICRSIARSEADRPESDIQPLVEELENVLLRWRSG